MVKWCHKWTLSFLFPFWPKAKRLQQGRLFIGDSYLPRLRGQGLVSFQLYTGLYERAAGKMMSFLSPALLTLSLFSCAIQFLFHLKGIYFSAARSFKGKRTRQWKKAAESEPMCLSRSLSFGACRNKYRNLYTEVRRTRVLITKRARAAAFPRLFAQQQYHSPRQEFNYAEFILSQPIGPSGMKLV